MKHHLKAISRITLKNKFEGIPPLKSPGHALHLWRLLIRPWMLRQKKKEESKFFKKNNLPNSRFNNLMRTAQAIADINPAGLHELVKAVLRPMQAEHILSIAEFGHGSKTPIQWQTFFGPAVRDRIYESDGMTIRPSELDPGKYPISLARDIVLPWPWKETSYASALATIGTKKTPLTPNIMHGCQGEWRQDLNHAIELWLPWRIGFVTGGNHSIAAGILAGEGTVIPYLVLDFSYLFDELAADGTAFYELEEKRRICDVHDPRVAAVFEIGRMIHKSSQPN
ncbi:DUF6710 family protein [Xanthomonas campestris]|uniref:DUF6710 family protein n=1 Tax=Xanthomonas campestris TaxID=339 RepID=UPI0012FE2857|nr:DUF6710 family protein [Xanthomonas campestris]